MMMANDLVREGVAPLAFIGPGGPEILVVMLVLLLLFGSKEAPRIFRKVNEMIHQLRMATDAFKREVMYGDLMNEAPPDEGELCDEAFHPLEPTPDGALENEEDDDAEKAKISEE